ncbi:g6070 [Coccomyxa viridis]|uniref:G6070 protein n=1 Tax=Coccomyxa viridis TaxID=1274662 RepID=A0ABP1FUG4_9CHLO
MTLTASTFKGTALPTQRSTTAPAGRRSVVTEARFLRGIRPKEDVKKGKEFANSKVKKAGKLLPNNPKILNEIGPSRAGRLSNVRNVPRQGGFGAGLPYQKPKAGIPSARGIGPLAGIDPLLYVGGLIAVFLVLIVPQLLTNSG